MLKRVALSQVQTGDRRLAGVLAALVAEAGDNAYPLHNIATFVFEDGKALFAGLGADEHTEFEIGSVTKTFNADLLEQAIELGEATPGTTVEEVFGERVSGTPVSPVTLEELANHTSGLPRTGKQKLSNKVRAVLGLNPDVGITVDDVVDQAVAAQVEGRGTENYSNLGHDLLGLLLAESAGTNYPGLIKQRVLNPLGMGRPTWHCPALWRRISHEGCPGLAGASRHGRWTARLLPVECDPQLPTWLDTPHTRSSGITSVSLGTTSQVPGCTGITAERSGSRPCCCSTRTNSERRLS